MKTADLPRNIFFLITFLILEDVFVKKVAVQNCTENLSKNRSVVILKIKGPSSDKRRDKYSQIPTWEVSLTQIWKMPGG